MRTKPSSCHVSWRSWMTTPARAWPWRTAGMTSSKGYSFSSMRGVRQPDPEGQGRRRVAPGDGDREAVHLVRADGAARDEDRAAAVPERRAAAEERVALVDVGVRAERDGRDVELAPLGLLVQDLDVLADELVAAVLGVDLVAEQAVEHEGVVGVRAEGDVIVPSARRGGISRAAPCVVRPRRRGRPAPSPRPSPGAPRPSRVPAPRARASRPAPSSGRPSSCLLLRRRRLLLRRRGLLLRGGCGLLRRQPSARPSSSRPSSAPPSPCCRGLLLRRHCCPRPAGSRLPAPPPTPSPLPGAARLPIAPGGR